jgi:hypothetical protein
VSNGTVLSIIAAISFPLASAAATVVRHQESAGNIWAKNNFVNVLKTAEGAGPPVLPSFVSYSLEFAFFPDFAGNLSSPNKFSDTLLENLGKIQGSRPVIRVGGNTQ